MIFVGPHACPQGGAAGPIWGHHHRSDDPYCRVWCSAHQKVSGGELTHHERYKTYCRLQGLELCKKKALSLSISKLAFPEIRPVSCRRKGPFSQIMHRSWWQVSVNTHFHLKWSMLLIKRMCFAMTWNWFKRVLHTWWWNHIALKRGQSVLSSLSLDVLSTTKISRMSPTTIRSIFEHHGNLKSYCDKHYWWVSF